MLSAICRYIFLFFIFGDRHLLSNSLSFALSVLRMQNSKMGFPFLLCAAHNLYIEENIRMELALDNKHYLYHSLTYHLAHSLLHSLLLSLSLLLLYLPPAPPFFIAITEYRGSDRCISPPMS